MIPPHFLILLSLESVCPYNWKTYNRDIIVKYTSALHPWHLLLTPSGCMFYLWVQSFSVEWATATDNNNNKNCSLCLTWLLSMKNEKNKKIFFSQNTISIFCNKTKRKNVKCKSQISWENKQQEIKTTKEELRVATWLSTESICTVKAKGKVK